MIIITHDMGVVAEAADDIIVMYAGQVVEQASTLDLFDNPEHPVHGGAARRAAADRGRGHPRGPADRDPRPAARPDRPAGGVPLRAALSVRGQRRLLHRARCRELREIRPGPLGALGASGERARRARATPQQVALREHAPRRPLLQVTDLHKHFPIREGLLIERKVGEVKAVDGVSFDIAPGRDARPRRRVRLGQVDDRLLHPAAAQAHLRLGALRGHGADRARARGPAPDAARDADRLPGSVLLARPAHDRRRHRRRAADRARDRLAPRPHRRASASCSTSSASTRASRTATRTSSRAASGSGSGSPARSRSARS